MKTATEPVIKAEKFEISILREGTQFQFLYQCIPLNVHWISVSISQMNFDTTALTPTAADRQMEAWKVMRLLKRTLLKIVLIGTVIFIPIFYYVVLLSRSEKYNLHVSGAINTAIIQRKLTTRLKKPQATELRAKFIISLHFSFGDQ